MDQQAAQFWLGFVFSLVSQGSTAIKAVVDTARQHGVDADNATLDAIIANADKRKAIAEADAAGTNG